VRVGAILSPGTRSRVRVDSESLRRPHIDGKISATRKRVPRVEMTQKWSTPWTRAQQPTPLLKPPTRWLPNLGGRKSAILPIKRRPAARCEGKDRITHHASDGE